MKKTGILIVTILEQIQLKNLSLLAVISLDNELYTQYGVYFESQSSCIISNSIKFLVFIELQTGDLQLLKQMTYQCATVLLCFGQILLKFHFYKFLFSEHVFPYAGIFGAT